MTERQSVLTERDGNIGWIRLNRPERLNAFAGAMRDELDAALAQLEAAPEVRCIVITGVGRAFSTGGDVRAMKDTLDSGDAARFEHLVRLGNRIVSRIHNMDKPVVAAVNGPAVGAGACLALACDLRVASETASIGFSFMRVGLHPDWGGSYFLPRLVGPAVAAELIYTGAMTNAERAERLGLFNRVVPPAELQPAARALAGQIAANPPGLLRAVKRSLHQSLETSLEDALEQELRAQVAAFHTPEFHEGVAAFIEKRAPVFGNRVIL